MQANGVGKCDGNAIIGALYGIVDRAAILQIGAERIGQHGVGQLHSQSVLLGGVDVIRLAGMHQSAEIGGGHLFGDPLLRLTDVRPVVPFAVRVGSNLHDIEGEVRLPQIAPVGDEFAQQLIIVHRFFGETVALALIPQHAADGVGDDGQ